MSPAMKDGSEKKPMRRWRHLEAFSADEGGHYRYAGELVRSRLEEGDFRRTLIRLLAAAAASSAAEVAAGCVSGTGMEGRAVLLLPYAACLIISSASFVLLIRLLREGRELRRYVFEKTVWPLKGMSAGGMAAAFISLAALPVGGIRGTHSGSAGGTLVYAAAQLLAFFVCARVRRGMRRMWGDLI